MAINIINQNLDQFGLPYGEGQRITPQNFVPTMPMRDPNYGIPSAARDQVAELFNYNTLPGATKSFTPRSTMTTGPKVDDFVKNNPNATRGDFMKALQDGTLGNASGQLFDKNIDALFEGVNLDKDYFGSVTPTYQGLNDTTFRGNIDIDKESLNKKALESLPKGFFQNVGDQSSLVGPGGYPLTAMAMNPNRMTDAYSGFFNQGDAISRPNVQSENYNMDQSFYMNPNSVERPQNMFQRVGGVMQDGIESLRNKAGSIADFMPFIGDKSLTGMAMQGLEKVGKGIGNFFQGNPEQRARNEYNSQFSTGDIYGYGMGSASGANKDAFGYNTVSRFGDYEQHMIDTVEKLENLLTKTGRKSFKPGTPNFNKLKDYSKNIAGINEKARIADLEEKERFDQRLAEQLRKANTGYTRRGTRIDYGDYYNADGTANTSSSMNPSNSVGPTSNFGMAARAAKGGLIGYQNGGLASMFVRRR